MHLNDFLDQWRFNHCLTSSKDCQRFPSIITQLCENLRDSQQVSMFLRSCLLVKDFSAVAKHRFRRSIDFRKWHQGNYANIIEGQE